MSRESNIGGSANRDGKMVERIPEEESLVVPTVGGQVANAAMTHGSSGSGVVEPTSGSSTGDGHSEYSAGVVGAVQAVYLVWCGGLVGSVDAT